MPRSRLREFHLVAIMAWLTYCRMRLIYFSIFIGKQKIESDKAVAFLFLCYCTQIY